MENKDVTQDSSPVVSEDSNTQTQPIVEQVAPLASETPAKGSQTPPEHLYAALTEERRLRKEAEDKLNNLTATPQADETSDEGKLLQKQIDALTDKLELKELHDKFPELKGLSTEFDEFRKDYPRHKGENIAKIFLSEKGLLEAPRKGLEKPTGGTRVAPSPEMTAKDVETLRKTDYRKYTELIKKGLINI